MTGEAKKNVKRTLGVSSAVSGMTSASGVPGVDVGVDEAIEDHVQKKQAEAERSQAEEAAAAKAKSEADAAAVLEKSQESQRSAIKRKGRRASILTSGLGVRDQLGVPGA